MLIGRILDVGHGKEDPHSQDTPLIMGVPAKDREGALMSKEFAANEGRSSRGQNEE